MRVTAIQVKKKNLSNRKQPAYTWSRGALARLRPKRFEKAYAMISLRDLARHLDLSPTTVSRALNGYPEVNATTRARVAELAAELGYRPNNRARSLATGRAMAVGHVVPVAAKTEIVNPIFGDFIAGAGEVYSKADYDLLMSVVGEGEELQAYRDLKARGSVDGVILHGPRRGDPRPRLLHDLGLPYVVHGRVTDEPLPYSWVDVNNRRAFHRATQFLIGLGHRRIGLVNGSEDMDFALRRRAGFESALSEAGLEANPHWMFSGEMSEANGHDAARRWLAMTPRPTALVVSSIVGAIGVRRAADEAGLRLGRDISVMIFDDDVSYLRNGAEVPLFTAMRSSVREAGRLAARMLLDLIADPDSAPRSLLLEADLVLGLSTGPAP